MDRLAKLPDRELVLTGELMEFAFADETGIALVVYTPTEGQPPDTSKEEWDAKVSVLNADGSLRMDWPRGGTHTIYDDPNPAIGTPADFDIVAAILANVEMLATNALASAVRSADRDKLAEMLAPTDPPPPEASDAG